MSVFTIMDMQAIVLYNEIAKYKITHTCNIQPSFVQKILTKFPSFQQLPDGHPDGRELCQHALADPGAGPDALRQHLAERRLQPLLLLLQVHDTKLKKHFLW